MSTQTIALGLLGLGVTTIAGTASAQVIDGTVDGSYGGPIVTQTVQTQFGDASDPNGLGGGGELNAAYAIADINTGRLSVILTGNIEPNFNKLSIFIDSQAGGENVLDGALAYDFSDLSTNLGGLTFDSGFTADYHLFGRWNGGAFELDIVNRAGSTAGAELGNTGAATTGAGTGVQTGAILAGGAATTNADAGGFLTQDVPFGFNNTNTAGVMGGTAAADTAAAEAVTTGLEFSIALADIGSPGLGDTILIHAVYGNGDNNFHSNQTLGGLPDGTGNLGGDGAGNFTGNLSGVDFSQFGGDQFFPVTVVPEPASAALLAAGSLLILRRRR